MSDEEIRRQIDTNLAWLGALALVLLAVTLYARSLNNPFVFRDLPGIVTSKSFSSVKDWQTLKTWDEKLDALPQLLGGEGAWPVLWGSLYWNYRTWTIHPQGYRQAGLILHLLCTLLIYWISYSALRRKKPQDCRRAQILPALGVAVLFLAHPLQVEAALYISARHVLLAGFFGLLAFLCFRRVLGLSPVAPKGRLWEAVWYLAGLLFFLLALFSGDAAAALPVFLFLYESWARQEETPPSPGERAAFYIPLIAVMAGFGVWRFTWMRTVGLEPAGSYAQGLGSYFASWWSYLRLAAVPLGLSVDHDFPSWEKLALVWKALAPLGDAALLMGLWALWRRGYKGVVLGIAGFLAALLPFFLFIAPEDVLVEHRAYLGIVWLAFPVAGAWGALVKWAGARERPREITPQLTHFLAADALAVLVLLAGLRVSIWDSGERLWQNAVARHPSRARPYFELGNLYLANDKKKEAFELFRDALERDPSFYPAAVNRGILFMESGDLENAERNFKHALESNPEYAPALYNLAELYEKQGRLDDALEEIQKAEDLESNSGAFLEKEANILEEMGKIEEALDRYNQALAKGVSDRRYLLRRMARVALAGEYFETAEERFWQLVHENPESPEDRFNLGLYFETRERWEEAITHYSRAIILDPGMAAAHFNLARVYERQEKCELTTNHYHLAAIYDSKYGEPQRAFLEAQKQGLRCPLKKKGPF